MAAANSWHHAGVTLPVTFADVQAAADTIRDAVIATPTTHAQTLSEITGADLWVKYENQQYTGSFKERGARYFLAHLDNEARAKGVVAASAGNHAQGVAYHARLLGIPATIVMPADTPFTKVSNTEHLGARIELEGGDYDAAFAHAQAIAHETGATLVPAFDDALIIAGQGTVGLELLDAVPDVEIVVVPVGGGGLIAGIAVAAKHLKPDVRIIGVQAEGHAGMLHSFGQAPPPTDSATVAEGIAVAKPGTLTRQVVAELVEDLVTVSEQRIEEAIALYVEIEKSVVEGAGAASLAAVLQYPERFRGKKAALIASGGNIDARVLASVLSRALARSGRLVRLLIDVPDRTGVLAAIATVIAQQQGNIVEVEHRRDLPGVALKNARLELSVETRDRAHADDIVTALELAGYHADVA
jgi:threonine dehydratase